jgi:hypothetical protein
VPSPHRSQPREEQNAPKDEESRVPLWANGEIAAVPATHVDSLEARLSRKPVTGANPRGEAMSAPTTPCEYGDHVFIPSERNPVVCADCGIETPSYTDGLRDALDLMQATGPDVASLWKLHDALVSLGDLWVMHPQAGPYLVSASRLAALLPPRPSTSETTTP